jgi:hypothetical protein
MPSSTILCEDCAVETQRKKDLGCTNITCTPISGQDGFCRLSWEWPAGSTRSKAPSTRRAAKPAKPKKSKSAARKAKRPKKSKRRR